MMAAAASMRCIACTVVALGLGVPGLQAQTPSAADTLRLAGAYVERFISSFSNVVAEEQYVEQIAHPYRRRTLRSDFLLVRYPGATKWNAFRDVLSVDGTPVTDDREGRIVRLFLDPPESALQRARDIARAGARYHLTDLDYYNNPLLVLSFLQPADQAQFRFSRSGYEKELGATVRRFGFELTGATARAREYTGGQPLRGRVWIDEMTGRVVQTELEIGSRQYPLRITTLFTADRTLGIDVPHEMQYERAVSTGRESGTATYSNFRRFQVRTTAEVSR